MTTGRVSNMPRCLRALLAVVVSLVLAAIWGAVGMLLGFPPLVIGGGGVVIGGVVIAKAFDGQAGPGTSN